MLQFIVVFIYFVLICVLLGHFTAIASDSHLLVHRVVWLVCVCVCVCVSSLVTFMSPAKTAEPLEMLHEVLTPVGPSDSGGLSEPCIRWGPDPPTGRGTFDGVSIP